LRKPKQTLSEQSPLPVNSSSPNVSLDRGEASINRRKKLRLKAREVNIDIDNDDDEESVQQQHEAKTDQDLKTSSSVVE
jgi:hypothetical protein